jgi:hypothetical protein
MNIVHGIFLPFTMPYQNFEGIKVTLRIYLNSISHVMNNSYRNITNKSFLIVFLITTTFNHIMATYRTYWFIWVIMDHNRIATEVGPHFTLNETITNPNQQLIPPQHSLHR